jgi:RNA polymerase sigma-70 factor (ECF subfamily)
MREDDVALVKKTLAGDKSAFDQLVKQSSRRVFQIIQRFFQDRQQVEDITQDVFIRAYTSLNTYGQKRPFKNWLAVITVRICFRELQKRKSRRENLQSDFLPEEHRVLDDFWLAPSGIEKSGPEKSALLQDMIDKILQNLSPKEKMILVLMEVEGMTIKEVSHLMGLSQVNVKVSRFRARRNALKAVKALARNKPSRRVSDE